MTRYAYDLDPPADVTLGLIVLQPDETIEQEFRRMFGADTRLFISRVPSGAEVTRDTLQGMAAALPAAASLFPPAVRFDVVGYGCTSGTAQIGAGQIAGLIGGAVRTGASTEPVSALLAACGALKASRIGLLSPYVDQVSDQLRRVLQDAGVQTPLFGSFDEAVEAHVARISPGSLVRAAVDLSQQGQVDALFLSCTNLRTLDVIETIEAATGLPVLTSNLVLGWHMARLAGIAARGPGRLFGMAGG